VGVDKRKLPPHNDFSQSGHARRKLCVKLIIPLPQPQSLTTPALWCKLTCGCATILADPTFCFAVLGDAYYLTRQYEEAITAFQQALTHRPLWDLGLAAHLGLAASYSELGRAEVAEMLRISPNYSLEGLRQMLPYKDPAVLERELDALRKAGLK